MRVEIDRHAGMVNLIVIPDNQTDQDLLESTGDQITVRKETEPTEDYPLYLVVNIR